MKTYQNAIFFAIISTMIACNGGSKLDKKKAELEDLKKEQAKIAGQIKDLETEIAASDTTKKDENKIKLVAVTEIKKSGYNHYIEINGKVESDQNVNITAQSAGTILKVAVQRGQRVRKGQLLGSIDNELIARGISELKSNLKLVTTVYEKQKSLWDQQIGTEIQYLQAKNNKESLEIKLSQLNKQYDMSILKSTIDGVVDEVFIKEGENIAPGMPAFRVVNNSDYKLVADVPEGYISKIQVGNKVQVNIPDLGLDVNSKIANVSNVINPATRTFKIEIALKGDVKKFKSNMLAKLKIEDFAKPNTISIPINLVERQEDKDFLFVAEGKVAKKKNITIGSIYKNTAEVISGLNEGEKLITVGYQDLVDGQEIKY